MDQDTANDFLKQFGSQILEIEEVNALSVIGVNNDFKIDVSNLNGEQGQQDLLQKIGHIAPGLVPSELTFSKSNKLELFAPHPVCTQYDSGLTGVIKGSSGPFIQSSKPKHIGILSSHHVMPGVNKDFRIAQLHHMESLKAKVDWKDSTSNGLFDLGIAEIKESEVGSWPRFSTTIVPPVMHSSVVHYGGSSVEPVTGTVISDNATVKLSNITFSGLIRLTIISRHGDSGAPVVNENNELIGLIIGGDTQNKIAYCSNLSRAKASFPEQFDPNKLWLVGSGEKLEEILTHERRREIEMQLHFGEVIKVSAPNVYGEIISDKKVSVLIHPDHSSSESITKGNKVWFFAVPLEYVVKEEQMVGINNQTPLVAINITKTKRTLEPLAGLHKLTPCGTGTTIQSDPLPSPGPEVAMAGGSAGMLNNRSCYIVNDYGHLVHSKIFGANINAWDKVVCNSVINGRKPSPKATDKFVRRLLDSDFKEMDQNWKWKP